MGRHRSNESIINSVLSKCGAVKLKRVRIRHKLSFLTLDLPKWEKQAVFCSTIAGFHCHAIKK